MSADTLPMETTDRLLVAELLSDLGLTAEARERYAASADEDPWRAAMGLALLDLRAGEARRAEAGFQHALTLKRDAADAWLGRGLARLALGRPSAALVDIVGARARGADASAVALALGQTYAALGRLADAEAALAQAAADAPRNLEVQARLARVQRARGAEAEARATVRGLAAAVPEVHDIWAGAPERVHEELLARIAAGDMAAARDGLERLAASVEPTPRALLELAKLAVAVGDGDQAMARLDTALALAPEYADAHYVRGFVFDLVGRAADADACYRAALAADPHHWRAALNRAVWLADTREGGGGDGGALDEATRLLDVAERHGPGPIPPILRTRARVHARRGEAEAAAMLDATADLLEADG